jgi:hypothetical protein
VAAAADALSLCVFLLRCGDVARCVVRNPWDRLVSDWRWRRKSNLPLGDLTFFDFARFVVALVGSKTGAAAGWDASVPSRQFAEQYLGHFQAQVGWAQHVVRIFLKK